MGRCKVCVWKMSDVRGRKSLWTSRPQLADEPADKKPHDLPGAHGDEEQQRHE